MSQFVTKLELTPVGDGRNWELDAPLEYVPGNAAMITVPAGFVTDLASVPQIFWNILPPFGIYDNAAVLHDWLYRNHRFTRRRCDWLLLEAMAELGTPLWKRWVIYGAVRAFGWIAWRREP